MVQEVEVSTQTTEKSENPENAEYEEDDKEDKEEVEGNPEWHEETAVHVFLDRDLQVRLSRSIVHDIFQVRSEF